jgi:hypothetical protein
MILDLFSLFHPHKFPVNSAPFRPIDTRRRNPLSMEFDEEIRLSKFGLAASQHRQQSPQSSTEPSILY